MSLNNPQLGDSYLFSSAGDYMVFTERGWILCDNMKERDEEIQKTEEYILNRANK